MAERFRDLERPALIDLGARTTPTGGSQAAQALAQSLAGFSRVGSQIGGILSEQIGARVGAEEGAEGDPKFRSRVTAYGRAYNDAALRSYAIQSEIDLEEQAARLETEAGSDPEAFREAFNEMRTSVLAEAPAEARGVLNDMYNRRAAAGLGRIQARLATELRQEDRELVSEQLGRLTERVSFLRSQDTPEAHFEAQEEEAKLFLLIDAAVNDGTLSEVEGRTTRRKAEEGIIFETVVSRFANEMDDPYGDPIGFIEDLKEVNRTAQTLSPEKEAELENVLLAELRERNALRAARRSQSEAEITARHEAGDRMATEELLAGTLTQRDLLEMVQNDQLTPGTARTLLNELQSAGTKPAKSDPRQLAHVELNLLSMTEDEILTDQGLTWADRSRLIQKRRDEEAGWKGTQVAREAFDRIDRALGIVPGTPVKLLDEEELRQRDNALTQLYDRVDALPPEERQAAILEASSEVIRKVIKQQDTRELQQARERLAEARQKLQEAEDKFSENKWSETVRVLENAIRELEQKQQNTQ